MDKSGTLHTFILFFRTDAEKETLSGAFPFESTLRFVEIYDRLALLCTIPASSLEEATFEATSLLETRLKGRAWGLVCDVCGTPLHPRGRDYACLEHGVHPEESASVVVQSSPPRFNATRHGARSRGFKRAAKQKQSVVMFEEALVKSQQRTRQFNLPVELEDALTLAQYELSVMAKEYTVQS